MGHSALHNLVRGPGVPIAVSLGAASCRKCGEMPRRYAAIDAKLACADMRGRG